MPDALKVAAIGAETIVLGAVATVAYGLIGPAFPNPVVIGTLAACIAVEATRLPRVMRAPSLGPLGRCAAVALALCASVLTFEVLAVGVEATLDARALPAVQAEERLREVEASLNATKATADRLSGEVEAARRHVEEISRESVSTALRRDECGDWRIKGTKGWIYAVPGSLAERESAKGFSS
jgi:hypothetical protein